MEFASKKLKKRIYLPVFAFLGLYYFMVSCGSLCELGCDAGYPSCISNCKKEKCRPCSYGKCDNTFCNDAKNKKNVGLLCKSICEQERDHCTDNCKEQEERYKKEKNRSW